MFLDEIELKEKMERKKLGVAEEQELDLEQSLEELEKILEVEEEKLEDVDYFE